MSWALFKKKNKEKVQGFPSGSDGKESAHNVGDPCLITGLGRSPGEGNGYSLQYFCLENSRQSGLADPGGHKESGTTELLTHFFSSHSLNSDQTTVSSVAHLCPTLCDRMDCSTPGFPLYHQLLELTHVHRVGDATQLSHPLSSPSPPTFNLSQHQGLFQRVSSSHQVAKVLEFQLQYQFFQ